MRRLGEADNCPRHAMHDTIACHCSPLALVVVRNYKPYYQLPRHFPTKAVQPDPAASCHFYSRNKSLYFLLCLLHRRCPPRSSQEQMNVQFFIQMKVHLFSFRPIKRQDNFPQRLPRHNLVNPLCSVSHPHEADVSGRAWLHSYQHLLLAF